jgi:ACS family hexuronate transporter-like MFS transporter
MAPVLNYRQVRWFIVGWLTLSTILNVIDRQTLSILAPFLRDRFGLSARDWQRDYSNVVSAFLVSYTVMYAVGGRLVDRIGERAGMAACIVWWSVCTMLTSLARGVFSLGSVRFLLGIGEPANYPAALRACARWFPKAERGLPIAMFSSGSSVGNALAPPLIASLTLAFGWRAAFVVPGALGLLWTVVWLSVYRVPQEHPSVTAGERALLREADPSAAHRRWVDLLKDRNVLALVLARFVSDPVWYFYTFYMPDYLKTERGFNLRDMALFAWIPFVAGTFGGMTAGAISDWLIKRGWEPVTARTSVLYLSAMVAPIGMLTSRAPSAAAAIVLMAVVAFVVYCWFINTAAVIPDLFSEKVVGSVLGLMGTAGSAAGILFAQLVGFLLSHYSYTSAFALSGSMHLTGAVILWSLLKKPVRGVSGLSPVALSGVEARL